MPAAHYKVVILDTGCANLTSIKYAITHLGYNAQVTLDPQQILTADKLFLPGVGSAPAAMAQLHTRGLVNLIKICTQPVLGICLGMQLLASNSLEGNIQTLGIINAPVEKMPDKGVPLPHMGWNTVSAHRGHPLFHGIEEDAYFYFVHSYAYPLCHHTIAQTQYGYPFSAAVQQDNFYGVQFHPERSGRTGAQLLKNFLEI